MLSVVRPAVQWCSKHTNMKHGEKTLKESEHASARRCSRLYPTILNTSSTKQPGSPSSAAPDPRTQIIGNFRRLHLPTYMHRNSLILEQKLTLMQILDN